MSATDLTSWADRRDAQERLPQLVRRLILTTAGGVSRISFPAGEGVQLGGWDGTTVVQVGNPFVPAGVSAWELGVNRDPRKKAEEDYAKRSQDPLGVKPSESAFIFVTPRRWPTKDRWASAKTKEGIWREVRAYDADNLETWLELSPAVHTWITDHVGRGSGTPQPLETYWRNWSAETTPPLSADLVIGGRDEVADQILQRLAGAPAAFGLRADAQEEAVAFLASSIQRLPDAERDLWFARALVCGDVATWRWAMASDAPLLLVPLFEGAEVGAAVRAGHDVFIPLGRESSGTGDTIELPRLRRAAARDVLLRMGLPKDSAEDLATLTRRSLLSG